MYRRYITKSKAGHYRLTLKALDAPIKLTDDRGWSTKEQALQAEPLLAWRIEVYKGLIK